MIVFCLYIEFHSCLKQVCKKYEHRTLRTDWVSKYLCTVVPFTALIMNMQNSRCSGDHECNIRSQMCVCVFVCVFNFICDDNNRTRDELPWLQHQHPTIGQATKRSNQGRCLIISSAWRIVKWVMDLSDDFNNPTIMIIMGLFARSFAYVSVIFATDVHSHTPYQPINKLVKIPWLRKLWTKNMIIYHWLFNDGWYFF